jgi:hypothetical protein
MDEIGGHLAAAYAKLTEELHKVKEQHDRGDDDWEPSLLRVFVNTFSSYTRHPICLLRCTKCIWPRLPKWTKPGGARSMIIGR